MCGVGPLASARTAKWMRSNVPGVHIPDEVIKRLEGAEDQKKEGKQLCIDIINEVKEIEGVSGIHGLPPGRVRCRDRARIGRSQGPQTLAQGAQSGR